MTTQTKPFSQACANNQEPIRQILSQYINGETQLLEIGSGTGQHGFYMSAQHPELHWFPTDVSENLPGIQSWVDEAGRANLHQPQPLNIDNPSWQPIVDLIFSANTAHIMSWQQVEKLFAFVPQCLKAEGCFLLYGPFNYQGQYTSDSNRQFDQHLKSHDPKRGIRDFENLQALAEQQSLTFAKDHAMPANNRLLVWQKP